MIFVLVVQSTRAEEAMNNLVFGGRVGEWGRERKESILSVLYIHVPSQQYYSPFNQVPVIVLYFTETPLTNNLFVIINVFLEPTTHEIQKLPKYKFVSSDFP